MWVDINDKLPEMKGCTSEPVTFFDQFRGEVSGFVLGGKYFEQRFMAYHENTDGGIELQGVIAWRKYNCPDWFHRDEYSDEPKERSIPKDELSIIVDR